MAYLHFSMQMEDIIKHTDGNIMCVHFSMWEDDILEHTNAKCHLCTF